MINYSIIIPHKNTPDLLQRCLDSIPVRNDVQVIVVDDNSDADKVGFERFPLWKGEHYEYYLTKESKGAGYARNVGMRYVKGKWLLFADADDYLLPSVNTIFDEEINTEADIVFFRPMAVMSDNVSVSSKRADWADDIFDSYFKNGNDDAFRYKWAPSWSKFYRRELISENQIRFEEITYSNDNVFSAKAVCAAKKIAIRDKGYYVLTQREGSLTNKLYSKPHELEIRASAFFRAQQIIHDHGYPVNTNTIIMFLQRLYPADRKMFVRYFRESKRLLGYSHLKLSNVIFKKNTSKSRIKCMLRSYAETLFYRE